MVIATSSTLVPKNKNFIFDAKIIGASARTNH